MTMTRPTLAALIAQAKADIKSHMAGSDPFLRRSVEGALAHAMAGLAHGNYGNLIWLSKQLIPDMAEDAWMQRWAAIRGITPTPAVKAQLDVDLTGTDGTYTITGYTWTTNDGVLYTPNAASVTLSGGVATIVVTSVVAGIDGNQSNGATLTLTSAISGVDAAGTVSATAVYGFDQESTAALLARYLYDLRTPPKGGGPGDYIRWIMEVSGVTRAWEFPRADGAGTVACYFVCDGLSPIIPDPTMVAAVQAYLDTKAPVTVADGGVVVYAPTGVTRDFTIDLTPSGGGGIDSAAIRAAVLAELTDLILREATPAGLTLYLTHIEQAIAIGNGDLNYDLTSPTTDTVYAAGSMPLMGTITWL